MRLPTLSDLSKVKPVTKVRDALGRAQSRAGSEGRLIGLSAGLLALSFVLLAVTAPLGLIVPGMVGAVLPLLPLGVMLAGTAAGLVALVRIARTGQGAGERLDSNPHASSGHGPTVPLDAVLAALGEAEDTGLKPDRARDFGDVFAGRLAGIPVVIAAQGGATFAVFKVPTARASGLVSRLLITPAGRPWPGPLPEGEDLTPLTPQAGLAVQAWGPLSARDRGQTQLDKLAPALLIAAGASALPHLAIINRTLVLRWTGGDIAGAALIAGEVAKALPGLSASAMSMSG
jgi:hypothetical protein